MGYHKPLELKLVQNWIKFYYFKLFYYNKENMQRCAEVSSFQLRKVCSVQSLSHIWLLATPWTEALQASLSITNSHSLLKLMSIESVMTSNHLILCHPLLLLPSIFPSIRVFSNESALCIRWPKYQLDAELQLRISPSNKYSGLISFRIDCFDLLAVQGTLKTFLQHCIFFSACHMWIPYF